MLGGRVSLTVTVKEQIAELPLASVAVQLTVVVPTGKAVPDDGLQTTTGLPKLPQLPCRSLHLSTGPNLCFWEVELMASLR